MAILAYVFDYSGAARTTQPLILITGALFGILLTALSGGGSSSAAAGRSELLLVLVLLLSLASLWHPDVGRKFAYLGQIRWTGPWDNPNLFGVLMGVATVWAAGLFAVDIKRKDPSTRGRWLKRGLLLAAASATSLGLLNSYSRGAWLATAFALAYLGGALFTHGNVCTLSPERRFTVTNTLTQISRLRLNGVLVISIIAAAGLILFWQIEHTDTRLARRIVSATRKNDLSWRTRVAAWEGTLQMMADRTCGGFGWNQAESAYDCHYRAFEVPEHAAIQMNDYFILGSTLGVPALACFLAYVLFFVKGRQKERLQPQQCVPITYRAGTILLLIGFWFDGGLFKIPITTLFWITLAFSSSSPGPDCDSEQEAASSSQREGLKF